jgi:RimJ/RimL family protein N-acetyltransferase
MPGVEKPILLDFPDSFETERLLIRAPRVGDGQAMNAALVESIHNLKRWLPMHWTQNILTVDETEELVRQWVARWLLREDLRLTLIRKSDGLFLGHCGLHRPDWAAMRFEIGYWVRASLEGHGYVREAVAGVTAFAFDTLGAERIELRCDSRNDRSIAVAERAGYTLEGRLRHDYHSTDKTMLKDTLVYSLLRPEYLERKQSPELEPK